MRSKPATRPASVMSCWKLRWSPLAVPTLQTLGTAAGDAGQIHGIVEQVGELEPDAVGRGDTHRRSRGWSARRLAWLAQLGGRFRVVAAGAGVHRDAPAGRRLEATVWSATRDADGRAVAIKLVPGPADDRGVTRAAPHRARSARWSRPPARPASSRASTTRTWCGCTRRPRCADGTLALVLDLVDGGSYAAVVAARGHLHPGEVVTALSPVSRAVAHLHALGVVHADLSPGNVLFTREGRPMVSDLGVARLFGEQPETLHGTEGFTAPEVLWASSPPRRPTSTPSARWRGSASPARRRSCPRSGRRWSPWSRTSRCGWSSWSSGACPPTQERVRPPRPSPWTCTTRRWPSRCSSATAPTPPPASRTASAPRPGPPRHREPPRRRRRLPFRRHLRAGPLEAAAGAVAHRSAAQEIRLGSGSCGAGTGRGRPGGGRVARGTGPPAAGRRAPRRALRRKGLRSAGAGVLLVLLLAVVLGGGAGVWVHGPQARRRTPSWWTTGAHRHRAGPRIGGRAEPCSGRRRRRRAAAGDGGAALRRCARRGDPRPCRAAVRATGRAPAPRRRPGPGLRARRRAAAGGGGRRRLTGAGPRRAGDQGCRVSRGDLCRAALRRALGGDHLGRWRPGDRTGAGGHVGAHGGGRDGDRRPGRRRLGHR